MKRIKSISPKLTSKKTTQQLIKDWASAKKRVTKELSKEKDQGKKKRLELFALYLENNFVDQSSGLVTTKYEKGDLTNICGPKEFGASRWKN